MGVLLEQDWNCTIGNLASSFEIRLVEDALTPADPSLGFFFATVRGEQLGNVDILYDPRRTEQIVIGRVGENGRRLLRHLDEFRGAQNLFRRSEVYRLVLGRDSARDAETVFQFVQQRLSRNLLPVGQSGDRRQLC